MIPVNATQELEPLAKRYMAALTLAAKSNTIGKIKTQAESYYERKKLSRHSIIKQGIHGFV